MGVSSTSVPASSGSPRARLGSVNSAIVVSDQLTGRLQAYSELWGRTNGGIGVGSAYTVDGGLRLLVNPNFALDAELSRSLGAPGGASMHTFGFGAGWRV